MGLFGNLLADSSGPVDIRPKPVPAPLPIVGPLVAGIYQRPWTETEATSRLADLAPKVVRILYPCFQYYRPTSPYGEGEVARLTGLIERAIEDAESIGAQPLIVTSVCLQDKITPEAVAQDAATIAKFYAEVATRHPRLWFEFGNEVEIGAPNGSVPLTATEYAAAYTIFHAAVHAADPYALVCTAGTSGLTTSRIAWIRDVLTRCKPDAVSAHPYGCAPGDYAARVRAIGTLLPVWFTEYGSQYDDRAPSLQAAVLERYFSAARGVVPVCIWFALSDLSADNGQQFGLMDAIGVRRASYAAAKTEFSK